MLLFLSIKTLFLAIFIRYSNAMIKLMNVRLTFQKHTLSPLGFSFFSVSGCTQGGPNHYGDLQVRSHCQFSSQVCEEDWQCDRAQYIFTSVYVHIQGSLGSQKSTVDVLNFDQGWNLEHTKISSLQLILNYLRVCIN